MKLRQSRRHNIRQLLGKADRPFVGKVGKDDMLERINLLLDRAINVGVAVPEEVCPPRAHNIEILLPVNVLQPYACAALYNDGRQLLIVLHLRAGMPDVREIPLLHG